MRNQASTSVELLRLRRKRHLICYLAYSFERAMTDELSRILEQMDVRWVFTVVPYAIVAYTWRTHSNYLITTEGE